MLDRKQIQVARTCFELGKHANKLTGNVDDYFNKIDEMTLDKIIMLGKALHSGYFDERFFTEITSQRIKALCTALAYHLDYDKWVKPEYDDFKASEIVKGLQKGVDFTYAGLEFLDPFQVRDFVFKFS